MIEFEAWAWGFGWGIFATIATWFFFSIEASIARGEARAEFGENQRPDGEAPGPEE